MGVVEEEVGAGVVAMVVVVVGGMGQMGERGERGGVLSGWTVGGAGGVGLGGRPLPVWTATAEVGVGVVGEGEGVVGVVGGVVTRTNHTLGVEGGVSMGVHTDSVIHTMGAVGHTTAEAAAIEVGHNTNISTSMGVVGVVGDGGGVGRSDRGVDLRDCNERPTAPLFRRLDDVTVSYRVAVMHRVSVMDRVALETKTTKTTQSR